MLVFFFSINYHNRIGLVILYIRRELFYLSLRLKFITGVWFVQFEVCSIFKVLQFIDARGRDWSTVQII